MDQITCTRCLGAKTERNPSTRGFLDGKTVVPCSRCGGSGTEDDTPEARRVLKRVRDENR